MKKVAVKFALFLWGGLVYGMGPSLGGAVALREARGTGAVRRQLENPEVAVAKEMILITAHFLSKCLHENDAVTRGGALRRCSIAHNMWLQGKIVFKDGDTVLGEWMIAHLSQDCTAGLCRVLNKRCYTGDEAELRTILGISQEMAVTQEVLLQHLRIVVGRIR